MDISLIAVGKCRDKAILSLADTYLTRLKPYAKTSVLEVTPKATSDVQAAEGTALLEKVPQNATLVVLDEQGKTLSTAEFAQFLQKQQDGGCRHMAFLIGGADGHSDGVKERADLKLSLSSLTFPHMLVRPIVLEQIYRALSLNAGHPYHRE